MEKIPYIINARHGGIGYSKKAIDEYNARKIKLDPNFTPIEYNKYDNYAISRTNKIMADVINDLGEEKASGKYAGLVVNYIIKEYEKYVILDEYDGFERLVGYDLNKYKIDHMKKIMELDRTDGEKFNEFRKLLELELSESDYDFENP